MTWMRWANALMRYYPGLNHLNIPKMTVWQFIESFRNMGWLENQGEQGNKGSSASAAVALGQVPDAVPSIRDIRAMAKRINPDLVIPKE